MAEPSGGGPETPTPEGAPEEEPQEAGTRSTERPPGLPGWARWLIRGSFFSGFLLAYLMIVGGTPVLDALWTGTLLLILPGLSIAQLPLIEAEAELDRREVYVGSGALLLILGLVSLGLGVRRGGAEALGLVAIDTLSLLGWTGGLVAVAGVLVGLFHVVGRVLGIRERPILRRLLPVTGQERALFGALSLCAGFGEELAYRGWLIPVLAGVLGSPWWAAALSSGVFGVLHAYQGPLGILRTGLMGFGFAAGFILTGSLWPAVVAHAVVDILAGLVFKDVLLEEDPGPAGEPGKPEGAAPPPEAGDDPGSGASGSG